MNFKNVKSYKLFIKKTNIFLLSILFTAIFFVTSCENFLNGSNLKDTLEDVIEYNNAPYAKVTIISEGVATSTLIPAAGSYNDKYKVTSPIDLMFEPNPAYNFIKWISTPGDAVKFEKENELSTTATILKSDSPITIQPYVLPKDKLTIHFASEHGSTVPAEEKQLYLSDEFSLSYKEESGYAFTGWKVIDELTGDEVSDVLEISGKNSEVNVKVLQINKKVLIKAESIMRPKVVGATPIYDSNGVYRDRRIIIMFDNEMDESSIYFNEKEQTELTAEGYVLLFDENHDNKCYGYCKETDNKDSYVYKNIKITNRKNRNTNLLAFYSAPYFDKNDKSVLRIDTKHGEDAPPAVTDILVSVEKSMFFFEGESNSNIEMAGEYSWTYYTNNRLDTDEPQFTVDGQDAFDCQFAANDQIEYISSKKGALRTVESLTTDENYIDNNLKNKKLFVKGTFSDGGSGPSSLKWNLYKINSSYYPMAEETFCTSGQIDDLDIIGSNATIKTRIHGTNNYYNGALIEINQDLEEGAYRIDFIAYDKNELGSIPNSFYFVHDTTPPKLVQKNTVKNCRPAASNETLTWKDPDNTDFAKIFVEQYFNGEKTAEYEIEKGTQSRQFTGMSKGKYQYKFYSEDIYGNRTKVEDSIEWKDDVKPAVPEKVYIGAVGKKRIRINYTVPNCEEYDSLIISGDVSRTVENGIKGKEYYEEVTISDGTSYAKTYYLKSVDFAGNESDPVEIKPNASDIKPGMICYKSKTNNEIENFFFCFDYCSDMSPLGVVCDSSDTGKIKIWDLTEVTGYCWGKNDDPCSNEVLTNTWNGDRNTASGLDWYNYIMTNKTNHINYTNGSKNNCHTIWYYLKNYKNNNSPVTWYIPGITEFDPIIKNFDDMEKSFNLLKNENFDVTFFTKMNPYWTGCPRFKKPYANAVMLNKSNDGCSHEQCKYGSNTLYITGEYKESSWYYKDEWQCEISGNKAALITHAMAQVNMNSISK